MRSYLMSAFVLLAINCRAQLAALEPDADLVAYEEQLEAYMTGTRNDRAEEAYANFIGSFLGGGFTEAQQKRIVQNSVLLANFNARAEGPMADYLDIQTALADDERAQLFGEFHDMLTKTLDVYASSPASVNNVLTTSLNFLTRSRLDNTQSSEGWYVAGGKPAFRFEEIPLLFIDEVHQFKGSKAKDSLIIQETQLYVDLTNEMVNGKGGRTDWQRVGLSSDIFVRLVDYNVNTKRDLLLSDSAHLQYPPYFGDKIIYGQYEDRVLASGPREAGEVPSFVSTDRSVTIDNIGENMSLLGRFELRAARVYATTDEGADHSVTLQIRNDREEVKMRGASKQFMVVPGDRLTGQQVDFAIYFGEDSLYHPSASIDVDIPQRLVKLKRTKSSADRAPFLHSANRFAISADNINVYLDGDSAVVGRTTVSFQEKGDVRFESENYFNELEYTRIRALAGFNPLEVIYRYQHEVYGSSDTLSANGVADRFQSGLTSGDIESVLFDLQSRGFLTYNPETQKIIVSDKLEHYVLSAREAKDYDRLSLISSIDTENAFIDLKAGTILVEGVKPIQFNAEKQLAIKPYGGQVAIVGDRNIDFSGQVYAGNAILTGNDFHFKYEPYYIQFDSVRYIDLFLPEGGNPEPGARKLSTASRLEHVSGYLLLDAPKNKSGSEDIAYFPSLQTRGPSYIYYDQADSNSLYSRDSFYFELAPFSLNNLDSLTETNLNLEGELVSGGIFPRMKQQLQIQEDGSLGFIARIDTLPESMYGDRGAYTGEVTLNNGGLVGNGTLKYLEAEITSPNIRFGVDSATTTAQSFVLNESITENRQVPEVRGEVVSVTFMPYGDSLAVAPQDGGRFDLFGTGDHTFDGTLVLTPEALRGGGRLDWSQATVDSEDFNFGAKEVVIDTASVSIKSQGNSEGIALTTNNVNADFDFATGQASFGSNGTELNTRLPYIQFRTSSDRFDWDMAGGNITFATSAGKDRFTSNNPDQDSLTFTGTTAVYDNLASQLKVGGVPYVISADARIIPGDSNIVVQPGGKIQQLTNAQIVADTLNQYHVINRATVDIAGRKEYTASGFYEYNVGDHVQEFELQNIVGTRVGKGLMSEKETATRAEGQIDETTRFYIDDKTRFYGTIELDAGSKELAFDGYARIEADKLPTAEWFVVESMGDKNNLVLNTKDALGKDAKPLYTGFYLSKPERHIYPTMIQTPQRRVDHPILDASGVFTYDEENDAFLFGDSIRVNDPDSRVGNLMVFDHQTGMVRGDGELGIGGRLKYISMRSYGTVAMELPEQFAREPEPEAAVASDPRPAAEEVSQDTTAADGDPATITDNMFLLEEEVEETPATDISVVDIQERNQSVTNYPETEVELMTAIDLILPKSLTEIMVNDIASGAYSAPQLLVNQRVDFATAGIETLFPAGNDRDRALAGLAADAVDLAPAINKHTFLFTDMKMRWNVDYQSFVSTEALNGLASVAGQPISRRFETYMEVKMTTGGDDRLYLYLKSPSETYYFFGFKDGILNVVSNNNSFMNELRGVNPKDLVLEMDDGLTYEILEVTPGTAQTFLRRVKSAFETEE
ncbi:hypothetical protein CLV84_3456 [Neolewinella xylanilytica]|uniref:Uncharacterized protein n=1 Tax=Neolewinella xylanilytica TaxID=1514080 RepID=A0A2S6I5U5_9BACT|nr:hypothetical protein [Neolewinella xylanilytica]PPK86525.1 hypothetical protein CLV84_3456 [Neolewinella xylanilytica]